MEVNRRLYFIAIIPPKEVADKVQEIKYMFKEKYNTVAALKSPAHITLQPPFSNSESEETQLIEKLQEYSFWKSAFEIVLKKFSAFIPRTIYIDVVANESLIELQKDIVQYLKTKLLIVQNQVDLRTYKAHVTVANRDIKPNDFKAAWEEFENKPFDAKFEVSGFSLLKYNGTTWDLLKTFPF